MALMLSQYTSVVCWFTKHLLITANKSIEKVLEFLDRLLHVCLNGPKDACLDASEIRFNPLEEEEDPLTYE